MDEAMTREELRFCLENALKRGDVWPTRHPKFLLLDEPTSALDLKHRVRVMGRVNAYAKERSTIVIVVLHEISFALGYADSVVVLEDCGVHACGDPETL